MPRIPLIRVKALVLTAVVVSAGGVYLNGGIGPSKHGHVLAASTSDPLGGLLSGGSGGLFSSGGILGGSGGLLGGGSGGLFGSGGLLGGSGGSTSGTASSSGGLLDALQSPVITVTSAPASLTANQAGTVSVQAAAPAKVGERISLQTPGPYNLGYNSVSSAVLDADLRATLKVAPLPYLGTYNYWADLPANGSHQEGKSASFNVPVVSPSAQANPTCGGANPTKSDGTPWTCTYDDEFSGSTLDSRYWTPQVTATSGFTTGTSNVYACAENDPRTIAVTGGNLELSLVRLPAARDCGSGKTSRYMFGQVMAFQRFSQTYGRYEIRAKVPDLNAPGIQQSFWLWPTSDSYGPWPSSGEMDLVEMYSSYNGYAIPYFHYVPAGTGATPNQNRTTAMCPIKPGEFNTYDYVWAAGTLTVAINGQLCIVDNYSSAAASVQGAYSPFDKPFYLNLNQAMGTTGNEYDPNVVPSTVTTQVDYVRIWK